MCGLVGVAGAIGRKEEMVFRTMLIFDTIRGDHSTGVAMIDKFERARNAVVKEVGPPSLLFKSQAYIDADKGPFKVLMGHNRFATRGAVNTLNAHPFRAGHIIGAHNGTLENKWNFPEQEKFATDSETFFNMVYKKGVTEAVENCRGAWAYTFWDEEDDTLNLIRNKERTLYFTSTKDNKTFFWASEEWMLKVATSRVGVEIGKTYMLREDTLLTIPVSRDGLGKESTRPLKGKEVSWAASYPGSSGKVNRTEQKNVKLEIVNRVRFTNSEYFVLERLVPDPDAANEEEILMYTASLIQKLDVGDIITADVNVYDRSSYALPATARFVQKTEPCKHTKKGKKKEEKKYYDHKNNEITRDEWLKKYQYCTWCNSDLDPDEDNLMLSSGDVLCQYCQKDKDIKELIKLDD